MHYVDVRNHQRIVLIKKKPQNYFRFKQLRGMWTKWSSNCKICALDQWRTVKEATSRWSRQAGGKRECLPTFWLLWFSDAMTECPCVEGQPLKERRSCVSAAHSLCCLLALSLWGVFCFVLETGSHYVRAGFNLCSRCPFSGVLGLRACTRPLPYNLLFTSSEMVTMRNLSRRYMGILCVMKMIHKFKIST